MTAPVAWTVPPAWRPLFGGRERLAVSPLALSAIELLPVVAVSLLLAPFIIEGGTLRPWNPNLCDLQVYRVAVADWWRGLSIYDTVSPTYSLRFIYPPFAAVIMAPFRFGTEMAWELIWTVAGAWALVVVLRRCRVPRGWPLATVAVGATVCYEPIRTTLGYGQVNTLLLALIMIDLLPGDRPRLLPRGSLIGLAAAIKLTPLLFAVFLLIVGAKKAAAWAGGVFAGLTLVGAVVMPVATLRFFNDFGHGRFNTGDPWIAGNQSWTGVVTRLTLTGGGWVLVGLVVGLAVAALATVLAAVLWRHGEKVVAVGLVGLATCLASPLSWTHHWVWGLVCLLGVVLPTSLARWARFGLIAWACWLALCPPLTFLPLFGESKYSPVQWLMANAGPAGGTLLIMALAVEAWNDGLLRRSVRQWLTPEPGDEETGLDAAATTRGVSPATAGTAGDGASDDGLAGDAPGLSATSCEATPAGAGATRVSSGAAPVGAGQTAQAPAATPRRRSRRL